MRKTVVAVAEALTIAESDRAFVGIAVIAAGNSLIPTSAGSAFAGVHGYKQNDDGGKQGGHRPKRAAQLRQFPMRFCKYCGAQISDTDEACPSCRRDLKANNEKNSSCCS